MSAHWAQEADPDGWWRLLRWSYGWETGTQRAPTAIHDCREEQPHEREQPERREDEP